MESFELVVEDGVIMTIEEWLIKAMDGMTDEEQLEFLGLKDFSLDSL